MGIEASGVRVSYLNRESKTSVKTQDSHNKNTNRGPRGQQFITVHKSGHRETRPVMVIPAIEVIRMTGYEVANSDKDKHRARARQLTICTTVRDLLI